MSASHPGAINIEGIAALDNAVEVARLWVQNNGPSTCLIDPDLLQAPEIFGMLMMDAIRHGARAYAQTLNIDEGEALVRILNGYDRERRQHSTEITTLRDYEPSAEEKK